MKVENKFLSYKINYCNLMCSEGLHEEYLAQLRLKQKELVQYKQALATTEAKMKVGEQQIREGVEKKNG